MKVRTLLLGLFLINISQCYDSDSSEGNRIEVNPFYDTIIFSDIADIINEFENNNSPSYTPASSNSESEENIEDLLSEYQHYLERAHKQRVDYFEKTKTKSNIPLFRHDRYSKLKPSDTRGKYGNFYYANSYFVPTPYKLPQQSYNNPLDILIPLRSKEHYMTKLTTTAPLLGINNNESIKSFNQAFGKKIIDSPPIIQKTRYTSPKSLCFCKNNQIPCDCNCKQCVVSFGKLSGNISSRKPESINNDNKILYRNEISSDKSYTDVYHPQANKIKDPLENVNIRVKVDVQIPRLATLGKDYNNQQIDSEDVTSRELTSVVNLPYLNFPLAKDMFGYNKASNNIQNDNIPIHKITIHKKKKSKLTNNNKKHKKKFISFHNIKVEPSQYYATQLIKNDGPKRNHSVKIENEQTNTTVTIVPTLNHTELLNETQKDVSSYSIGNVTTNKTVKHTEDEPKSDNSIDSDYSKMPLNVTSTEKTNNLRVKRSSENDSTHEKIDLGDRNKLNESKSTTKSKNNKEKKLLKKSEKIILSDSELLYWPSTENKSDSQLNNITYRILENEKKKTKLNMSKETLLKNHTGALEQAIFGKADWDDVDAVAPEFMSFVGKYLRGVLTFCSQSVCHSMNCAQKTCMHRICTPEKRLNNKGHCSGSSTTDSIASMESIMDLPSNIAFEIVDILQERMLGKLYGKMTLCITTKCVTFAASKKIFTKSKCNAKELNPAGQCQITEVKFE